MSDQTAVEQLRQPDRARPTDHQLTFAALEARLKGLPDGPSADLQTPKVLAKLSVVGTAGVLIGLAPALMVLWWTPQIWMAWVSWVGLALTVIGYVPSTVYFIWITIRHLVRWQPLLVEQLDHDIQHWKATSNWLARFPREMLLDHQRFAQEVQRRMAAKLPLIVGSLDRLGLLPILASLLLLARTITDPFAVPPWQAGAGMFLALLFAIGWTAALTRLRIQQYEDALTEALAVQERMSGSNPS